MLKNPSNDNPRFNSQTVLITGTTNSLGRSASIELVKQGAGTLIMGVRNVAQGKAVKSGLLQMQPNMPIHVIKLQLDDYNSIMAFCNQVNYITKYFNDIILNVGVSGYDVNVSKSDHKNIIQVNIYSNILLALKLLPLLKKSS